MIEKGQCYRHCPFSIFRRAVFQMKPHYEVTAAIIRQGGKVLVTLRSPEEELGGLWEFPGGKREPGESLQECLKREIKEELGIDIEVKDLLATINHTYPNFSLTLYGFNCTYLGGAPQPIGCADWRWVDLKRLPTYPLPEADRKLLDLLLKGD